METIPPTAAVPEESQRVLQQLDDMLEQLLVRQREEQECILNRNVTRLPVVCEEIKVLSQQLEQQQLNLRTFIQSRRLPAPQEKLRGECMRKFKRIQQLARQNHMLLENSLRFLQQVMSEFLGAKRKQGTYNHMGMVEAPLTGSGLLVDVQL
ncbi:MAG: flagellar export chaperone FlgN [Verrucomicrobium sp.]|nr:flagellar export chaperone FlgN [Verrucomicrobium sp.]